MKRYYRGVKKLRSLYKVERERIRKRLKELNIIRSGSDEQIFQELCFCLLTPQSKAVSCDAAIQTLAKKGLLLKGAAVSIIPELKGRARFHNKKASYIVLARTVFEDGGRISIKKILKIKDPFSTRDWLVDNVKGLGYKEASHFLRNIGLGRGMAILDRHILKNLIKYGVIKDLPLSLGSRKIYTGIEKKIQEFCSIIGIPPEELDMLFWSSETGFIFK